MEGSIRSQAAHQTMEKVVHGLVAEVGFDGIDGESLYHLTDILETLLLVLGKTTRDYTELCGRSQANSSDVTAALSGMSIVTSDMWTLIKYAKRPSRPIVNIPEKPDKESELVLVPEVRRNPITGEEQVLVHEQKQTPVSNVSIFKSGPRPGYIPEESFPVMPIASAYLSTPCYPRQSFGYVTARVKAAEQKMDARFRIANFFANTSTCHYLFKEKSDLHLIAPKNVTYLDPLIFKDQMFDSIEDEDESRFLTDGGVGNNETETWKPISNPFLHPPGPPLKTFVSQRTHWSEGGNPTLRSAEPRQTFQVEDVYDPQWVPRYLEDLTLRSAIQLLEPMPTPELSTSFGSRDHSSTNQSPVLPKLILKLPLLPASRTETSKVVGHHGAWLASLKAKAAGRVKKARYRHRK